MYFAAEIQQLTTELQEIQQPEDPVAAGLHLGDVLTQGTAKWIELFCARSAAAPPDIIDWWFGCLFAFGTELEDWAAQTFTRWGEHWLPDLIAAALDGEVETVLDEAYAEIVELFPQTLTRRRIQAL